MKKPSELSHEEWNSLYPRLTLKQIADQLQCSESSVHKWITRAGFTLTKKNRAARSAEHSRKIGDALLGKTRERTGIFNKCEICSKEYYVIPARAESTKFCSIKCKGVSISKNNIGTLHPRYIKSIVRHKICEGCGCLMKHKPTKTITSFLLQKFCTKKCADEHGLRYFGEANKKYKGDAARRKNRTSMHSRWATKVIQRDSYKCMRCNVSGEVASLQAHHIFPFELFPDKRDEIENGITLCSKCHWEVHDTLEEKYIYTTVEQKIKRQSKLKKGVIVLGDVVEGKVFGKDSRKWKGDCYWCGELVVKRLSDVVGKKSVFCSSSCRSKHNRAFSNYRPSSPDLIPATARPPESDVLGSFAS